MVYKTLSIKNNFWQRRQYFHTSWVPRGSKPNTYSAPTIASNQLLVLLFQKSSSSVFTFHQLLATSAPLCKRCWETFSDCLQVWVEESPVNCCQKYWATRLQQLWALPEKVLFMAKRTFKGVSHTWGRSVGCPHARLLHWPPRHHSKAHPGPQHAAVHKYN